MGRLFRFVVSGKSVAELKDNMSKALSELNGEQTTTVSNAQIPFHPVAIRGAERTNPHITEHLEHVSKPTPMVGIPTIAKNQEGIDYPAAIKLDVVRAFDSSGEKDSMGLPWDERIHSANQGQNKDGSWRTRRGVEPSYVKQVEQELIARLKSAPPVVASSPAPSPALPPLQPSAPVVPVGNLTAPVHAALPPSDPLMVAPSFVSPVVPPPAPIAPPPPLPPPPQATSAHSLETFRKNLIPTLGSLTEAGKITPEYVAALKKYFGVEQIWDVNDTQLAEMFTTFCEAGLLTKVN